MGKSQTVNCVGVTGDKSVCYCAMTKTEMKQEAVKAERRGKKIVSWYAQTKAGIKMLGSLRGLELIDVKDIRLPSLSTCPVCDGQGKKVTKDNRYLTSCVVCNGSGVCRKGHEKGWQDWQIESMKKEFTP